MGMIQRPAVDAPTTGGTGSGSGPGSGAPTFPLNLNPLSAAPMGAGQWAFDDADYLGFGANMIVIRTGTDTLSVLNPTTGWLLGTLDSNGSAGAPCFALGVLWCGSSWYNSATNTWTQLTVAGSLVTIDGATAGLNSPMLVDPQTPTQMPVIFHTAANSTRQYGLITGSESAGFTLTPDATAIPSIGANTTYFCTANGGFTWISYFSSVSGGTYYLQVKQTASGGGWTPVTVPSGWNTGADAGHVHGGQQVVDENGALWAWGGSAFVSGTITDIVMYIPSGGIGSGFWIDRLPGYNQVATAPVASAHVVVGPHNSSTPMVIIGLPSADAVGGSSSDRIAAVWTVAGGSLPTGTQVWNSGLASQLPTGTGVLGGIYTRPATPGTYNWIGPNTIAQNNQWMWEQAIP